MAKQQRASRSVAKKAAKRVVPKASTRKASASKPARQVSVEKPASARITQTSAQKPVATSGPVRRRKQRAALSHYREEDFAAGLRAYARYRDLGVAEATDGLAQAHVIRLIGPCDPEEVAKLHYHDAEFQLVYVLNGWVKTYMDGVGEQTMRQGSSWTQPPRIRHLIRDYSDNCELLEVILPAEFRTVEVKA